jgi:hypothetical protein
MIDLSVLVLMRDPRETRDRLLPELHAQLRGRKGGAEILCLTTGPARPDPAVLAQLAREDREIRVVVLEPPQGVSSAIDAGLAAAHGQTIALIEGTGHYPAQEIGRLVARLSRADAVFGCRRMPWPLRSFRALLGNLRSLLGGVDVRDPGCLLWAATREALEGLRLEGGSSRGLPKLVAANGFRVSELHIEHRDNVRSLVRETGWLGYWLSRKNACYTVTELQPGSEMRAAA